MTIYDFFTKTRLGLCLIFGFMYLTMYNVLGFELTVIIAIGNAFGNSTFNEK